MAVSGPLVLATRRSPLALRQSEMVAATIGEKLGLEVELLPLVTTGDRQTKWSLEKSGGKGLFTKELEEALLNGRADLAVHSAKDMPTEMPAGLDLVAFLPRENPADILVTKQGVNQPKVIATGSPRRRAQGSQIFPEAQWIELRGNVETRLKKIAQGREAEATLLAAAGLNRLQISQFPGLEFRALSFDEMVPAPGQGAIAVQARSEERSLFQKISNQTTEHAVRIERSILTAFGGGCQVALGAHYSKVDDQLSFFHEKCGIKKLSLIGKVESDWKKELIEWTTKS
jgi:hydroxymethylbilane synthase